MKIMLLGDCHGDLDYIARAARAAEQQRVDRILQLGDFGVFWPGSSGWLTSVDKIMSKHNLEPLVFVDGNHEGWDTEVGPSGLVGARIANERDDEGFVILSLSVRWATRSHRWTWEGVNFGAFGGAVSVDQVYRTAYVDWWPDEAPNFEDLEAFDNAPLDILCTHDMPSYGPASPGSFCVMRLPDKTRREVAHVRSMIDTIVDRTHPSLVVHGHWHIRYGYDATTPDGHDFRIEGLGANVTLGSGKEPTVLNLQDGKWHMESPGTFGQEVQRVFR